MSTTPTIRRPMRWLACWLVALASLVAARAFATSYYVDTAAQFNAGVDKNGANFSTLQAGDRVYLKGGNWDGLRNTLTGSMTDAEAQANPALIQACDASYVPMIGGVTVNGLSAIALEGTGIVVAGLTFSPTSGMFRAGNYTDYSDDAGTAFIIQMKADSRYMTASHLKFDYCGRDNTEVDNDHYGAWLLIYGYRHTVQYCEFAGRDFNPNDLTSPASARTSIRQATIVIYKNDNETSYGYHTVRYCYFGQRKVPLNDDLRLYAPADGTAATEMSNGWETIRVGNSSLINTDLNTTVEYNAFYHAIQAVDGGLADHPGEPEMISNKSRNNTYRYNTILNGYGHLCLRQGDYGVVQGNYFLAGGAYDANGNIVLTETRNSAMGGVRAFGFGHVIANNYFYKLTGEGIRSALCLGAGSTDPGTLAAFNNGDAAAGYETATYAQVMGNTFIDCGRINLSNQSNEIFPTYGTQFVNNLVFYGSNTGADGIIGQYTDALANHGGAASGNYVFSATANQLGNASALLGAAGNTITTTANPLLTDTFGVLAIPSAGSPVIGQAAALPVINDTSPEHASYDLAGHVASNGGADLRGLARPPTGRDIGAYEREAAGTGVRPLRRSEVGRVAASYPNPPVVAETFADNTRTTQNAPTSLAWFTSGPPPSATVASGELTVGTLQTRQVVAYFPTQTLAVGDVLTLSFNFSVTSPTNLAHGVRAGLLYSGASAKIANDNTNPDLAYTGYGTFINPSPTAPNATSLQKRENIAKPLLTVLGQGTWTNLGSGGPMQSLLAGTLYTATFTVRRTGADQVTLVATYRGGALSGYTFTTTDNFASYSTFDTLVLGVGSNAGVSAVASVAYRNITVTHVAPLVAVPGAASALVNTTIDLDLKPLVSDASGAFNPLTFSVSGVTNGSVSLLADGTTARFTPTGNYAGAAGFTYSVTDGTNVVGAAVNLTFIAETIANWRQFYFGTTANTGTAADPADPDGDGFTNLKEYLFGTIPTAPSVGALFTATPATTNIVLTFIARQATGTGYTGLVRHYALEFTTDLSSAASWAPLAGSSDIVGADQTVTITEPRSGPNTFYRLRTWLQ